MELRKIIALITAMVMAVSLCGVALADDDHDAGNPPDSPEFMLRSDPDEWVWTSSFAKGGIAEAPTMYKSMDEWKADDAVNVYEGKGGYTWLRIDGVKEGIDTLILNCESESSPIRRLTVTFSVDDDMDVTILGISTDDVDLPELSDKEPVHPIILLASNPTTGFNWVPDNSITDGLKIESEYVPTYTGENAPVGSGGVEHITLIGEGDADTTTSFSYARSWEDSTYIALFLEVHCDDDTDVEIAGFRVHWE